MNTVATSSVSRLGLISNWIVGPYRARGERYLAVRSDGKAQRIELGCAKRGTQVAPGVWVRLTHKGGAESFEITVPTAARVQGLRVLGSEIFWNGLGHAHALEQQTLRFAVPASGAYAISWRGEQASLPVHRLRIALQSDRIPLALDADPKALGRGGLYLAMAVVFHLAVLTIPGMVDRLRGMFPDTALLAPLAEWSKPPVPIETAPIEVSSESDFAGSYSLLSASERAGQQAEKAAKSVQKSMGSMISRLSSLAQGKGGVAKNTDSAKSTGLMGALSGLRAQLGSNLGGSAAAEFKYVAKGKVGAESATLFGSTTQALGARDMDEILAAFRGAQEAFRGCYESALLKDENMSVSVDYESTVAASGRLGPGSYGMVGQSTDDGERMLKGCLEQVLTRIKISPRFGGAKIQYQFMFKS